MKTILKLVIPYFISFFFFCLLCTSVQATASVTTATGGSAISADTTGGSYTTLTGPTISEGANGDVGTGTIILSAPSGFNFNTGQTVTATITRLTGSKSCFTFSSLTATPTSTTITFTVSAKDGTGGNPTTTCKVDFSNIQVRPTAGTPLASGNITKSGTSTISGVTGSTNFGTLTEVVGAKNKLAITTNPSSTAIVATNFSTAPQITLQDQFGNTVTTDSTSTISRAPVLSTQACGGTAGSGTITSSPADASAVTAGVLTYSSMSYSTSESIKICFTSSGVTSVLSSAITVVPAAPTNVAASDGTYTDKVTITWTKSTGATTYHVWRDSTDITPSGTGDVATYDDTGAAAPTITAGTASASDGTSTSQVALSISGQSANNGTTYTYKVVAYSAVGNSADSNTNTGYRGVGSLTYQWYRSSGDADSGFSILSGATSASYNDTTAPAPTITAGTATASDATSVDYVSLNVSGQSASSGTGLYYYAVLSATGATSQNTNHDRGYIGVGPLTYQWQRSAADSNGSFSDISGATTASYNDTGAPADGSGRYFRLVESAAGASNQTTAADRGYRAFISITISDSGTISFGTLGFGQVKNTTQLVPTGTKTLENTGNIVEKFNVSSSNATGGTAWTLGNNNGVNIFKHEFSSNGGSNWTTFPTDNSYATFATGVGVNTTKNLDLQITVPTSSDNVQKSITVTVQASQ